MLINRSHLVCSARQWGSSGTGELFKAALLCSCHSLPPKSKPFPPTGTSGPWGQGAASSCSIAVGWTLLLSHDPKHKPHVFTFLCAVGKDFSAIQNGVSTRWKLHSKSPYVPEEMPNKVMIALYVHSWLASIKADSWWGMPSYAFLLCAISEHDLSPSASLGAGKW